MIVSVVIPVYNAADYLPACLESVVNQTWQGLQIILVDDGSTDDSRKICDESAAKDKRIEVMHLTNGGPSIARNVGTERAKGKYLLYMDADDEWGSFDFVEKLVAQAEKTHPDVILFEMVDFCQNGERTSPVGVYTKEKMTGTPCEIMHRLMQTQHFSMSACQKFIRRDLLYNNGIHFTPNLLCEDIDWIMRLWPNVHTVEGNTEVHYRYRQRTGSRSRSAKLETLSSFCSLLEKWQEYWEVSSNPDNKFFLNYLAFLYVTLVYSYFLVPKSERRQIKPRVLQLSNLLQYSDTPKSNRLKAVKQLFGNKMMLFLFSGMKIIRMKVSDHFQ